MIKRNLGTSKDQKTVIEKLYDPSPTVMKESGIFMMPGKAYMGQHISSITEPETQDIFCFKNRFKYADKKV